MPRSSLEEPVYVAVLCLSYVYFVVLLRLLHRNKQERLFKVRNTTSLVLSVLTSTAIVTVLCWAVVLPSMPCGLFWFVLATSLGVLVIEYLFARSAVFFLAFKRQQKMLEASFENKDLAISSDVAEWTFWHKMSALAAALNSIVYAALYFTTDYAKSERFERNGCRLFNVSIGNVSLILLLTFLPAAVVFYFKVLTKFEQNYYIQQEQKITLIFLSSYVIVFHSFGNIPGVQDYYDNTFRMGMLMGLIFPFFVVSGMFVIYPLMKTRRGDLKKFGDVSQKATSQITSPRNKASSASGGFRSVILSEVLNDPDLLEEFRKFLIRDFAVENLLFIESVDAYKAAYSAQSTHQMTLTAMAGGICSKYVSTNSAFSINISGQARVEIKDHMERNTITPQLFDTAYSDVKVLLSQDVIPRFRKFLNKNSARISLMKSKRQLNVNGPPTV